MFSTQVKSQVGEDISLLIRPDNHPWNYICECGDASGLSVKEYQDTQAIFISHTHIDHFINFDQIVRHQIGSGRRVVVCGPAGIARQVQAKIRGYTWNLIEKGAITYEIREVIDANWVNVYEVEPPKWELKEIGQREARPLFANERFEVHFTILDHKTPSLAFLFKEHDTTKIELKNTPYQGGKWVNDLKQAYESGQKQAPITVAGATHAAEDLFPLIYVSKGHRVGIIMDHAANADNHRKIQDLFLGCDRAFIECFYKDEDQEQAEKNFHSYATQSARIMRECLVKEAIPVHFSRKYQAADIQQILQEFEREFKK